MIVKLGDICTKGSSNIAQNELVNCNGQYPIYGASGLIKHVDFYKQDKEYIAIVKDGAGVGRVMMLPAYSSIIGTMQYIFPTDKVDIHYLYYALTWMNLGKYFSGATIPHIYFKDYQNENLNLPSKEEQKKIVNNLESIDKVIDWHKELLTIHNEAIRSRFLELFGDPIENSHRYDVLPLPQIGECKNGMNFHYNDSGVEINCLGVGDFKDHSIIDDTSKLPLISLNEMPTNEYLLQNGDIVFVRSNGNKALVGRSIAVYPNNTPTTFSGFCIRFRIKNENIRVPYLLYTLKMESVRKQMAGRGANIQNLNQQILSALKIPVPPIELQENFSSFVAQIDEAKKAVQESLDNLEILKKSLMQKYFG